jgi:hypothetical protein
MSHLQSLMPLYTAVPERFKRQVDSENGTSDHKPPPPPPPQHMHFKFNKVGTSPRLTRAGYWLLMSMQGDTLVPPTKKSLYLIHTLEQQQKMTTQQASHKHSFMQECNALCQSHGKECLHNRTYHTWRVAVCTSRLLWHAPFRMHGKEVSFMFAEHGVSVLINRPRHARTKFM